MPNDTMIGYTRTTIRAVADAVIPRTPELEESLGAEHVPGAVDVDLESYLADAYDNFHEIHAGRLTAVFRRFGLRNYPYTLVTAILLDFAALELLLRRRNEETLRRREAIGFGGPFSALSRRDRLRAIALLEHDGIVPYLDERFGDRTTLFGSIRFLATSLNIFPVFGYYSEWSGYDPEREGSGDESDSESHPTTEDVQGWRQTGYPGPVEGHAALRGYEVEEFRENEY